MFGLRDYQIEIVRKCRAALANGFCAPLVVAPTGSGKTIIFAYIAKQIMEKGKRALILTHRREILEQTISKLYSFGITCGQIAAGSPMTRDKIQVAMIGTIKNRLASVPKPDLIIPDEAHHSTSPTWERVLNYFYDVSRIGFTATPERLDGQGLSGLYDLMIEGPTVAELVSQGHLSRPEIFSSPLAVNKDYHVDWRGDYDKKEQEQEMTRRVIVGDVISHYRKFLDGLPAVCFCVSIKHCEVMEDSFNRAGIPCRTIHGKVSREPREKMIRDLSDGTIKILCSCEVISEGVDIPVMAGCIMLRKTMSLGLYLQQAGRALRTYPGKKHAIILDHCGNVYRHGHVLNQRSWSLTHEKRDKKDPAPAITRCPACFVVLPGHPQTCHICGFDFAEVEKRDRAAKLEIVAGNLMQCLPESMQGDEAMNLAMFIERIKAYAPKDRQRAMLAKAYQLGDRDKIDALREALGYKRGWTRFIWDRIKQTQEA